MNRGLRLTAEGPALLLLDEGRNTHGGSAQVGHSVLSNGSLGHLPVTGQLAGLCERAPSLV